MASPIAPPPTHDPQNVPAVARALRFIERERLVIAIPALFGIATLVALPQLLAQDGWLALVAGRSIAHHGLPGADTLTVYTLGKDWIDQQWLSQLAFFHLHELGGMRLLMLVFAALVVGALIAAMAAARRRGASPLAVALITVPALLPYGLIALPTRTQVFGFVLFVGTLRLLVEDARRPSRRVFWVFPLLVLWANLHGSVLLGAGLVVLRGACAIVAGRGTHVAARHGLVLAAGALVAMFATPYALDMPHYYATTAFNPQFTALVAEWKRTAPGLLTAPFYMLLFVTVGLIARHPRNVTTYEKLLLLATGFMGLMAIRNIAWFALAAIMILPLALQQSLQSTTESGRRTVLPIAYGPSLCFVLILVVTVLRPSTWFEPRYPAGTADAVARITAADPTARVFSDGRYADWLMWKHPSLEGRVAFDARLELLTSGQLSGVSRFLSQQTDRWREATAGYRVVVVARGVGPAGAETYRQLLKEPGARLAYLDAQTAVVLRAQQASFARLGTRAARRGASSPRRHLRRAAAHRPQVTPHDVWHLLALHHSEVGQQAADDLPGALPARQAPRGALRWRHRRTSLPWREVLRSRTSSSTQIQATDVWRSTS